MSRQPRTGHVVTRWAARLGPTVAGPSVKRVLFALGPPVTAAAIGGAGARRAPEIYGRLRKPGWAPPAGAFGPVWTALYAGIAAAGWRLYPRADRATTALHLGQMALNAAWPVVFFAGRHKVASVVVITLLDGAVVTEIAALRRADPKAAALLVPYLGWSLFATALNVAVSEPRGASAIV